MSTESKDLANKIIQVSYVVYMYMYYTQATQKLYTQMVTLVCTRVNKLPRYLSVSCFKKHMLVPLLT